jgi:coenzyme F420-0:L-glutamate ligase / coenzyme F420-1:gamma-L-glutamate ligase
VTPSGIHICPLPGLPEIRPGDDLARLILDAVKAREFHVADGDIFVVAQKIVSKAEGQIVPLDSVAPSSQANAWARDWGKDARVAELVLRESKRVVRMERGLMIAETRHGYVCANAGVDLSNAPTGTAILLPENPDKSASLLCARLSEALHAHIGVVISDTFGRAWREGLVNVALGVAGLAPLVDYRGLRDSSGNLLQATVIAVADEIAAAAELVMGKTDRVPVAIVRGFTASGREGSGHDLIRPAEKDLFR